MTLANPRKKIIRPYIKYAYALSVNPCNLDDREMIHMIPKGITPLYIPFISSYIIKLLPLLFTILSLMLSLYILIKKRKEINFYLLIWFGLAILFSWGFAWFTGVSMNSLFINAYFPVARFVYPAIFPIILFIIYGWANILPKLKYKFVNFGLVIYFILFLYLDIISIFSINRYF